MGAVKMLSSETASTPVHFTSTLRDLSVFYLRLNEWLILLALNLKLEIIVLGKNKLEQAKNINFASF
jgi:hypothetical protein